MYVTPQDLIDEFSIDEIVELTDRREPRTHEVDTEVAQRACDRATAEIDAALSGRYVLPLASVPAALQYVARDLARYYLHGWGGEAPANVLKRYDRAVTTLRDIQAGRQQLGPDVAGLPIAAPSTDLPSFSAGAKDWAREA